MDSKRFPFAGMLLPEVADSLTCSELSHGCSKSETLHWMMKYVAITLQPIRIRLMFLLSSNAYFEYALNRIESCPNFALAPVR